MKTKYLEQLREKLNEFQACREDIDEIIKRRENLGRGYSNTYPQNKRSKKISSSLPREWGVDGTPKAARKVLAVRKA